jgi:hypothetical protein
MVFSIFKIVKSRKLIFTTICDLPDLTCDVRALLKVTLKFY